MPSDSLKPAQPDAQTLEVFVALVEVAIARARFTRQPIDAVLPLNDAQVFLLAVRDAPLIREAFRTGRGFSWRGDGPPTKENIVVFRRPGRAFAWRGDAPASLDVALCARARTITRQRPRERRERRSARTVGSRGDPSSDEADDEDHLAPSPDEGAA